MNVAFEVRVDQVRPPKCGVCGEACKISIARVEASRSTRVLATCTHERYFALGGQGPQKPLTNYESVDVSDQLATAGAGVSLEWRWPDGGRAFGGGAGITTHLDPAAFLAGRYVIAYQVGVPASAAKPVPMRPVSDLDAGDVIAGPFDKLGADDHGTVLTKLRSVEHEDVGGRRTPIDYTTIRYRRERDDAYFKARRQSGTLVAVRARES